MTTAPQRLRWAGLVAAVLLGAGPAAAETAAPALSRVDALKRVFARPAAIPAPADNPLTAEKVALGARLFADTRLSIDGTQSCATCHQPERGFSDGLARRPGRSGALLVRHTPSLWNLADSPALMWDGRATSLEAQARIPIEHPEELSETLEGVVAKLAASAADRAAFASAFPEAPDVSADTLLKALAAYVRSLVSPPTRFDRWVAGDDAAMSEPERRGFALFTGRARCAGCHLGFALSDFRFHDIGLPASAEDAGRGGVTGAPGERQAFRTPGLRELTSTAPYMHDGSLPTLEAVIAHYAERVIVRPTTAPELRTRIVLSGPERADLLAFLRSLSSDGRTAGPK